jgi:hypothetical protein
MSVTYKRIPLRSFHSNVCDACGRAGVLVSMQTTYRTPDLGTFNGDKLDVCERCAHTLERRDI